jgi:CRP-like cAMP-binding protein
MNLAHVSTSASIQPARPFRLPATPPARERHLRTVATPATHTGARQNGLLKALPHGELERLLEHLELVSLPFGKRIIECDSRIEYCYFPTSAVVSLVYMMADGATTELAVVGREGVVGVSLFEGERAASTALIQSAGYAYRLNRRYLRTAFAGGGALPQLLMRHSNVLFMQMAQNVVGGPHLTLEQKVARWLLTHLDRSASNELKATQEQIAHMLGVRRESVTMSAGKLQDDGLIWYRRGHVTVIDRAALERLAGACYTAAKTECDVPGAGTTLGKCAFCHAFRHKSCSPKSRPECDLNA